MSLPYRSILYSAILFLFPLSSQAEIKIYFGAPGYSHYKHNYYSHKNYRNQNSRYGNYYSPYSRGYYNNLSDLYRRHGNKHAFDRAEYYRNKYQNNDSNSRRNNRRYHDAYNQGFNDGRRSKRYDRSRSSNYRAVK